MKLLKQSIILFSSLIIFFSSCKNDVKLNAPYKEIPSIYAVLNPYEDVQMIRINKVFLGEGDANKMAKVADSINYKPDEITVTLKHSSNKVIVFTESNVTTSEGSFNTNQKVYVTSEKLEKTGTYTLIVKNTHTGNVFTASAAVIPSVAANQGYGPLSPPYAPLAPGVTDGRINYSASQPTVSVGSVFFQPVDKGKIYEVIIRSHFYNDYLNTTKSDDYVDYVFNDPKTIKVLSGTSFINITFRSGDYFNNMGLALSQKKLDDAGRKMYLMEYIVYASTQEYLDYIEFSKPSLSLNQNKPLYSNFDNSAALGLFTFRSTCLVQKELDPVFINAFSSNSNTCRYYFLNYSDKIDGCK